VRQQTTTNPERVPWLGVLFCGDGLQLLLQLARVSVMNSIDGIGIVIVIVLLLWLLLRK